MNYRMMHGAMNTMPPAMCVVIWRPTAGGSQEVDTQRHGEGLAVVEVDQRTQKVVPVEDKAKDSRRGQRGLDQGQDDASIDAKLACAVHLGCLVDFQIDRQEKLTQQEDGSRNIARFSHYWHLGLWQNMEWQ